MKLRMSATGEQQVWKRLMWRESRLRWCSQVLRRHELNESYEDAKEKKERTTQERRRGERCYEGTMTEDTGCDD